MVGFVVNRSAVQPPEELQYQVTSPVPLDRVWAFIYRPGEAEQGIVAEDFKNPDQYIVLNVQRVSGLEFQIIGLFQEQIVATLHGSAHLLLVLPNLPLLPYV